MSTGTIFLVAVLYRPTEVERLDGKKKEILVAPQHILADDSAAAVSKATLMIPRDRDLDADRIEVLTTNPF